MKHFLIFLHLLLTGILSGCGLTSAEKKEGVSLSAAIDVWSSLKSDHPVYSSKSAAQAFDYAALKVELDEGSSRSLLVLVRNTRFGQQWLGVDRAGFTTLDGRMTQLYMPGLDLSRIEVSVLYPGYSFETAKKLGTVTAPFEMDNDTRQRYQVLGQATLKYEGEESRNYWDEPVTMMKFSESIEIPSNGFKHINYYWLDPKTFFVWESKQKWWPDMPLISIQVIKPWEAVRYP